MSSSAPKRTHFQIERDRQQIADWYLQGLTQAVIAERINSDPEREYTLTQQTISNDIRRIQELWLKSSLRDFDEMKAQELAKIDRLEREYWRGWEQSCQDAETVRQEGDAKGVDKIVKTAKGQAGDPRFLAGVMSCIEKRCKILGIEAAQKLDVTSDGKALVLTYSGNVDPDEI